jgi:hypothetical protein
MIPVVRYSLELEKVESSDKLLYVIGIREGISDLDRRRDNLVS